MKSVAQTTPHLSGLRVEKGTLSPIHKATQKMLAMWISGAHTGTDI